MEEGRPSFAKDGNRLAARIAGQVRVPHPRTIASGAKLNVAILPIGPAGEPLSGFQAAINPRNAVFITRNGLASENLRIDSQYKHTPIGDNSGNPVTTTVHQHALDPAQTSMANDALSSGWRGWPPIVSNVCVPGCIISPARWWYRQAISFPNGHY